MTDQEPPPQVWPPPPTHTPASAGISQTARVPGVRDRTPPPIAELKWNWGAFSLGGLWCFSHGLPWLGAIPIGIAVAEILVHGWVRIALAVAHLALSIFLGFEGHRLAWRHRRFRDVRQFMEVQRTWMLWGVSLFILSLLRVGWQIAHLVDASPSAGP